MLLAQLAANAKADRYQDPTNWYRMYQQVLESIGWVVQASTTMARYRPPGTRFTIATVITDLFRRKVGQEELSLITETLNAFKRDPSGPGQFVFECPSHAGGIGNFQFGLATEEDENLILQLGRFAFETSVHITRLAFDEFPVDAKFQAGYLALMLNEQSYKTVRAAIAAKLGSRLTGSVVQLELAPD
jgi:hypothetical protein